MPPSDRSMLDPNPSEVAAAMTEAVEQANYRCRVGKLGPAPKDYLAFAASMWDEPEGVRQWAPVQSPVTAIGPDELLTLLGVAWWTDHLGRRHVRVVGRRLERHGELHVNRFGPLNEIRPAAWLTHPERLVIRRLPGGEDELFAACRCGVIDRIDRMAWMGAECGPCYDQRLEKPDHEPGRGRPLTIRGHDGPVTGVAFDATGTLVISVGFRGGRDPWGGGRLLFSDFEDGSPAREVDLNPYLGSTTIPFASDGRIVAVGEYETLTTFPARRKGRPRRDPSGAGAGEIALSSDGGTIAVASFGSVVLIGAADGSQPWEEVAHPETATGLAFSPDGRFLAYGLLGGQVGLFDRKTRAEHTLRDYGTEQTVRRVAFLGERRLLAACGPHWEIHAAADNPILVWDLNRAEVVSRLGGTGEPVEAIALSPDGSTVVMAGRGRRLSFRDADTLRPTGELDWHVGSVLALGFSPDGEWLVSGGADGQVRLWPWRRLLQG